MKSVPVKYINTQIGTPFYTPLDYRNLGKLLQRVTNPNAKIEINSNIRIIIFRIFLRVMSFYCILFCKNFKTLTLSC